MKDSDWITWAALGIGGYLLYEYLNSPSGVANSLAQTIANAWVNLTSPSLSVPQGTVVMPDGTTFPASQLTSMQEGFDSGSLTFLGSDGNTYQLSPQSGGSYAASICDDCE